MDGFKRRKYHSQFLGMIAKRDQRMQIANQNRSGQKSVHCAIVVDSHVFDKIKPRHNRVDDMHYYHQCIK